jgi:hypothetical protein
MQICQEHTHELKNAIRQRGLWGLVMANRPAGAPRSQRARVGKSAFDPLMAIDMLIAEQALRAFGGYLLTGRHCPLCEVEKNLGEGSATEWIDTDADIVLQVCRERRLISSE